MADSDAADWEDTEISRLLGESADWGVSRLGRLKVRRLKNLYQTQELEAYSRVCGRLKSPWQTQESVADSRVRVGRL